MKMDRKFTIASLAVTIVIAVVTGIIVPIGIHWGDSPIPELNIVLPPESPTGENISMSGKHLDLVTGVSLVQGNSSFTVPFIESGDSRLIVTVHNQVNPGSYNIEFRLANGETISTGQIFTVSSRSGGSGGSGGSSGGSPSGAQRPFQVSITEPQVSTQVQVPIAVKGTTNLPIPEGNSLWIVIQFGQNWWPQTAPVTPFQTQEGTFEWVSPAVVGVTGNQEESFFILAVLTPQSVTQTFLDWFKGTTNSKATRGLVPLDLVSQGAEIRALVPVTLESP